MRFLQFTAISFLVILCFSASAFACGPFTYSAGEYLTYRLVNRNAPKAIADDPNVELWRKYLGAKGRGVTNAQIADVVYDFPIDNLNDDYAKKSNNPFLAAIANERDTLALSYLRLAKRCEHLRAERIDPWFYPVKNANGVDELEEIISAAEPHFDNPSLGARYMLQAMRAAFTVERYQYCIELWEQRIKRLPRSVIVDMCENYVGGIYFRRKDYRAAMHHFKALQHGDIANEGLLQSAEKLAITPAKRGDYSLELEILDTYRPQSADLRRRLEAICHNIELTYNEQVFNSNFPKLEGGNDASIANAPYLDDHYLRHLALKRVAAGSENRAMWQYTAAFITMMQGHYRTAHNMILKARSMPNIDATLRMSIDVLEAATYALSSPLNSQFESGIVGRLRQLDRYIVQHSGQVEDFAHYQVSNNQSFFYPCDMMRKIVLSVVAPRYFKSGQTTKALFLTGLASNRLQSLVNCSYRQNWNPNFSTDIFVLLNQLSAEQVSQFVSRFYSSSKGELERFCAPHCFDNRNYYNEIIATLYMREERFDCAVSYFDKVAPGYDTTLNIARGKLYDPFVEPTIRRSKLDSLGNTKRTYAQYMLDLQRSIAVTESGNLKAELECRYSMLLMRAVSDCWWLMRYGQSAYVKESWVNPMRDWVYRNLRTQYRFSSDKELRAKSVGALRWMVDGWNVSLAGDGDSGTYSTILQGLYPQTNYYLTLTGKRCP